MAHHRTKTAAAAALLAFGAGLLLAPAAAQNQSASQSATQSATQGIPCRISFQDTTHGGDWETVEGEVELTRIIPQGNGRFIAFGNGHATVTYHPANGCQIVGSPWTANYEVTVMSEDGQTAEIDIASDDEPHEVVVCPATAHFQFDVDARGLPTVTAPLHEGSTPFSVDHAGDHGPAGDQGNVTLHYCTLH